MSAVRAVPHCGGAFQGDCGEVPILELVVYSGLPTKPYHWAACPAHLYGLLETVDGQSAEVRWLGKAAP